jgi:hypothetical protein
VTRAARARSRRAPRSLPVLLALAAAAALAGCGGDSDPCAGQSALCVAARVQGVNIGDLDQVRFTTASPVLHASSQPAGGGTFTLPVKVALLLPAALASGSTIKIVAEGIRGGRVVGTSLSDAVVVPAAGSSVAHTFTLTAVSGGPDMASTDLAGADFAPEPDMAQPPPIDMAGTVFVLPQTYTFAPVPRASPSPEIATFTAFNTTGSTVSITSFAVVAGDGGSFPINTPTCTSIPPGGMCQAAVNFKPARSIALSASLMAMFSDGSSQTVIVNGTGTPAWSLENIPGAMLLQGVWGSDPFNVYAVGDGLGIYHTTGDGVWTPAAGLIPSGFVGTSITGWDAANIWVGDNQGRIYYSTGDFNWQQQFGSVPPAFIGRVRGMASDATLGDVWAIGEAPNTPDILRMKNMGMWIQDPIITPNGGDCATTVPGLDGFWFAGRAGEVHFFSNTAGLQAPLNSTTTLPIEAAWMSNSTNLFLGVAVGAGNTAMAIRCDLSFGICGSVSIPGVTGDLFGMSGNVVGANVDVWTGGTIGGLGHYDGTNLTVDPVPSVNAIRGVWAATDGQIYTVGDAGEINHYY